MSRARTFRNTMAIAKDLPKDEKPKEDDIKVEKKDDDVKVAPPPPPPKIDPVVQLGQGIRKVNLGENMYMNPPKKKKSTQEPPKNHIKLILS